MYAIETKGLTKYYGKARGIIELDLTVSEGEFFGFIGPNGAGKSTTIRSLLGLIAPTGGEARILGMDIRNHREQILAQVGYLPSEAVFYPGMRVRDVLKLSADLRKVDCREEAARLCQRLQLAPDRKVEELSFGNRKKVAIVCALQHRPRLLILDEPTAGLDPVGREEILANIEAYRKAKDAAIMMVSHSMSDVARLTDRLLVMNGSKLAMDGTPAEVFTHAEELVEMGLNIPQVTQVFLHLRKMGVPVENVYTIDQAIAEIKRVKGGAVHA